MIYQVYMVSSICGMAVKISVDPRPRKPSIIDQKYLKSHPMKFPEIVIKQIANEERSTQENLL